MSFRKVVVEMISGKISPNMYTRPGFIDIPEGDHRAKICRVKSGKWESECRWYELTFQVSGYHGRFWHRMYYNPKTKYRGGDDKKLFLFFLSFGIEDRDPDNYKNWVGASGAIRIKHTSFEDGFEAQYVQFLCGAQRDKLPSWEEAPDGLPLCFSHNDIF